MNIDERIVALQVNIESLHSNLAQLVEQSQKTDQRIDQLTGEVKQLTGHRTNLTVTVDRLATS